MLIGIAGLGRMGTAIALRLLETDHRVLVWNRTPGRAETLLPLGAAEVPSAAALASEAELVISMVFDAPAVEAVYHGPDGLLSGDVANTLFVEMSTVRPVTQQTLAERVRAAGAAFLECPVGGTVGPALTGKLLGLAGGAAEDLARARPVLEHLCRRIVHAGPVGAGASLKLAINLPMLVYFQALGEAYSLCSQSGLDPDELVDVFADSSGGTNVLRARAAVVANAFRGGPPGPATFSCDNNRKDLRTMIEEAGTLGKGLPLTERTLSIFDQASADGWGGRDGLELAAYWARHG